MSFAAHIIDFIQHLQFPVSLPPGIEVMHPFEDAGTITVCQRFYQKYYPDNHHRWMIIGINPGRFGGGVTGIPFTDPIRLQDACGIASPWPRRQELSSVFIYHMIRAFGGPVAFYAKFYITAVSPLGFTKAGKNLNYYDDKQLQQNITPFVADCMAKQLRFGIHRNVAFCLGEGKNYQYLVKLNAEQQFFDVIVPLPHPRFIMQYRLKRIEEYTDHYLQQLGSVVNGQ